MPLTQYSIEYAPRRSILQLYRDDGFLNSPWRGLGEQVTLSSTLNHLKDHSKADVDDKRTPL